VSTGNSIVFLYGFTMSDSTSLSIFTDQGLSEHQVRFCDLIADTVPTKTALQMLSWTRGVYRYMCAQQPAFATAVERARVIAQHEFVDQIPEIIDSEPDLVRMRERVAAIKWTASKLSPRTFGDKLDITVEQRVDLAGALAEAKERAALRLRCDSDTTIEGEFETVPSVATNGSIDTQSVPPPIPDIFS
jgi:hypothetical protein